MASGVTNNYYLPYPLPTDPVDIYGDIQDLAIAVDSIVAAAQPNNIPDKIIATNTLQTIDSFDKTSYGSAEYLVQASQQASSKKTLLKIMLLHNGIDAYISTYGIIELGESRIPMELSASIDGVNVLLQTQISDADTYNVELKMSRIILSL